MKKILYWLMGWVLVLGMAIHCHGDLLVYEGYNYGLADGTGMGGVATAATGLTGNYTVAVTSVGFNYVKYAATGLAFGPQFLTTSGGSVRSDSFKKNESARLGAALSTAAVTGDLWNSCLVNYSALAGADYGLSGVRLNTSADGTGTSSFQAFSDAVATSNTEKPGIAYSTTVATYGGAFALETNTTYLVLTKFTNVGTALSAGTPGQGTLWLFTQAGYEGWVANSGLESGLSTYASAVVSSAAVSSGTFSFAGFLNVYNARGNVSAFGLQTLLTDEVRYGTTLADVVKVPGPAATVVTVR